MNSVTVKINRRTVKVPPGLTLWEAAKSAGIDIPALCFRTGFKPTTSCMVCVVWDVGSQQLIPSCSVHVSQGLHIDTECREVKEARKSALEFLLAEHLGDCLAPCQRTCPAHGNIPQMIRFIRKNRFKEALITIKRDIALPAVMGYICPAPCEKGCKRGNYDEAVSICLLKKFVAEYDLYQKEVFYPRLKPKSGKKIAIVGAGPTGLAAAYYLTTFGHHCTVFDKNSQSGGMLRYGVPEDKLPRTILDSEIKIITDLGVRFVLGPQKGTINDLKEVRQKYDAIILATGDNSTRIFEESKIKYSDSGFQINSQTFETSLPGVFAGGGAVKSNKMAIISLAQGKEISISVDRWFSRKKSDSYRKTFDSRMGKMSQEELKEYLNNSSVYSRIKPGKANPKEFDHKEAERESYRCFSCDCRKPVSCKLRQYAEEYQAKQSRSLLKKYNKFDLIFTDSGVVYEQGKCIKCGLCIQVTANKSRGSLGLAFTNRGYDLTIDGPFQKDMERAIKNNAEECVKVCPTGALAWKDHLEDEDHEGK
jgi:ferredoxin